MILSGVSITWPQITSGPCADAYSPARPLPPLREAACARLEEEEAALFTCLMKACASMGGGTMILVHVISRHKSLVCNFASEDGYSGVGVY